MNFSKKPKPVDWKKILIIAVVLAIAGYQWYTQNVAVKPEAEAVANAPLESFEGAESTAKEATEKRSSTDAATKPKIKPGSATGVDKRPNSSNKTSTKQPSNPPATKQPVASETEEFLVSAGGKNLRSPAGLIYGMGGGGEHRVDHVMRHGVDDPGRPSHGVFEGDQETILKLLDEAYELVKSKSKFVKSEESQGNTAYTVSMGRKIGFEGGERGKRNGNRGLNSVRLVLDGDRVITAYPYR